MRFKTNRGPISTRDASSSMICGSQNHLHTVLSSHKRLNAGAPAHLIVPEPDPVVSDGEGQNVIHKRLTPRVMARRGEDLQEPHSSVKPSASAQTCSEN